MAQTGRPELPRPHAMHIGFSALKILSPQLADAWREQYGEGSVVVVSEADYDQFRIDSKALGRVRDGLTKIRDKGDPELVDGDDAGDFPEPEWAGGATVSVPRRRALLVLVAISILLWVWVWMLWSGLAS